MGVHALCETLRLICGASDGSGGGLRGSPDLNAESQTDKRRNLPNVATS